MTGINGGVMEARNDAIYVSLWAEERKGKHKYRAVENCFPVNELIIFYMGHVENGRNNQK